jgi:hypothetical protein
MNPAELPNGWLLTPAANLIQFLIDEMVISSVTQRALMNVNMMPLLLEAVRSYAPNAPKKSFQQMIDLCGQDIPFAKKEQDSGFATIFSHSAVTTWGAIETTIEHILVNHLSRVDGADRLVRESAPNLRDRTLRFTTVREVRTAIRQWEGALPTELSSAVDRAIHMLKAFSIELALGADDVRNLSELAEIRNVLLHQAGSADQRFVDKCPWYRAKVGDKLCVTYEMMQRYFDAAGAFSKALWGSIVKSPYIQRVARISDA